MSRDDAHAAAPMDARETPQTSVNRYTGRPSECDLTLVILWSRVGTPLPPGLTRANGTQYQSGTVWEYEDALAAGKPIYIYRRTAKPQIDLDDLDFNAKREQYESVKRFFQGFTNPDGSLQSDSQLRRSAWIRPAAALCGGTELLAHERFERPPRRSWRPTIHASCASRHRSTRLGARIGRSTRRTRKSRACRAKTRNYGAPLSPVL